MSDHLGRAVAGKHDVNKAIHVIMCQGYHIHEINILHTSENFFNAGDLSTLVVDGFSSSSSSSSGNM
jgi:hypothetical protein